MRSCSLFLFTLLSSTHGAVEEVTSETQYKKILADNVAVAVDFYSQTCGPCIMMAPIYKDVSHPPESEIQSRSHTQRVTLLRAMRYSSPRSLRDASSSSRLTCSVTTLACKSGRCQRFTSMSRVKSNSSSRGRMRMASGKEHR